MVGLTLAPVQNTCTADHRLVVILPHKVNAGSGLLLRVGVATIGPGYGLMQFWAKQAYG